MLWFIISMLALDCLVQCAVPSPSRTETAKPVTTKQPNIENTDSRQKAQPTVKTTKKSAPKKPATPAPVNEFALNDILFKGRQSNEANAFLKANEQKGKALETIYEHIREQDLNDIEVLVKRRNQMRFFRH